MKQAISVNTMDEYRSDLVHRYGFLYAQTGDVITLLR